MLSLAEYRRTATRLADYLPWAALVAPGVVLNKDGSFQRTARFRGPDLDSAVPAELVAVADRLNNAFRRLGSGWALFVDAHRVPAQAYPDSRFPDAASALVEAERKALFEAEGAHFESHYFLTLLYRPPADDAARADRVLVEGRTPGRQADARDQLAGFIERTDRILQLLEPIMPEYAWASDTETLTYLHATVSTKRQNVCPLDIPVYLDAMLADQPLTGGLEPRLGPAHLRVLTITGFPRATTPGILDDLNRLALPYRWTTRAVLLDKLDATRLLTRIRRQWFAKRKSIAAILKEVMTQEAAALVDTDAHNKAMDADAALQALGADVAGAAYVTATVTVWDEDAARADDKIKQVEKVIAGRGFTVIAETLNAVEAWLGSLPGHVYANVRQPPLSTLNLAHLIPLSAVWAGPARNAHLDGPPLLVGQTAGATPFRLDLHVGDVGHTLVAGPTGAGKSVLLALMALQFRRYADAQIFAFDVGGSLRLPTLAMGGDWQDLSGALSDQTGVTLQPLARIDDAAERAWARDWLIDILGREGVTLDPAVKAHLWTALTALAAAPAGERTLTGLTALLQSQPLKRALAPYGQGGPYGRLLDAETERFGEACLQTFEIEALIGAGSEGAEASGARAAPAVLAYLFHRIEDRLDGRPTLLIIDEGWRALDDPAFAGRVRDWLKTLRKKNAAVVFATQSLADIDTAPIAPVIIESCPTRILLPNARAREPQIAALYRRFGLNDRQIELLARARPKQEYYCQSRAGHRLFDLALGEVALAICAAAAKSDHAAADRLLAEHGPDGFLPAWLRHRHLGWAADLIPHLNILEPCP